MIQGEAELYNFALDENKVCSTSEKQKLNSDAYPQKSHSGCRRRRCNMRERLKKSLVTQGIIKLCTCKFNLSNYASTIWRGILNSLFIMIFVKV